MVKGQRADKEEIVTSSIHHKMNANLVHDDGFTFRRDSCLEQLAVDLASNHQALAQVGHSYLQTEPALSGADNSYLSKGDGLGSFLGPGDFSHDHGTPEADDNCTKDTLDCEDSESTGTICGDHPIAIANGHLGLYRLEECASHVKDIQDTRSVVIRWVLPPHVAISNGCPIPEKSKDEPAENKGGCEVKGDVTPAHVHQCGPKIEHGDEEVLVPHTAIRDVAVTILGYQTALVDPTLSQVVSEQLWQGARHFQIYSELNLGTECRNMHNP